MTADDPTPDQEPADPWGPGVVIPPEWRDPAPRVVPFDLADHMERDCACGLPELPGLTHGTNSCCDEVEP